MKKLILFIFIPFIALSQEKSDTTKLLLHDLGKQQIAYLCNGEIDKYLGNYSKNYTDLGGGSNGDGTIDFAEWGKHIKKFLSSEDFKKIKGKSVEGLVDVESSRVLDYSEIIEERGEINKFSFTLKEGDYLVLFPPKEDSPFHDGWFGIFRKENDNWKIVAGD